MISSLPSSAMEDLTLFCAGLALLGIALLLVWPLQRSQAKSGSKRTSATAGEVTPGLPLASEPALQQQLPSVPHLQGCFVPYMGKLLHSATECEGFPFENDMCVGKTLAIHRATHDPALERSGNYPFGYVFKGNKFNWEVRVQLQFKQLPKESVSFGIELDKYVPLMGATKSAMKAVVSAFRWVVGDELYHSIGDDPAQTDGEAERPIFAMPLWAFDQFVETPEGQAPPSLADPNFRQFGLRRADQKKELMRALKGIQFRTGVTYTFSFWSISQFMDNIKWQIKGIVPGVSVDFDNFCSAPPVHIVMYELKKPNGRRDPRHLQSRKNYLFHLAFWSSERKPAPARLRQLLPADEKAIFGPTSKKAAHVNRPMIQDAAMRQGNWQRGSYFSGCFAGLQSLRPRRRIGACVP